MISLPTSSTLPGGWGGKGQLCSQLTIVVDAVDQTNPNLGMVVGHEDDVEELLAVRVELTQLHVHCFQCLQHPGQGAKGGGCQQALEWL